MSGKSALHLKPKRERDELARQISNLERADAEECLSEQAGESSHYSDHPADSATVTHQREMDQALIRDLNISLQKADRAI